MVGDLSALLSPDEVLQHSARVNHLKNGQLGEYVALVVSHGDEGALVLIEDGTLPTTVAAIALHRDLVTRTTQLADDAGYQCELLVEVDDRSESLSVSIRSIEALQSLLHVVKGYVALADDLQLHAQGRSHQWVAKYVPPLTAELHQKPETSLFGTSSSTSDESRLEAEDSAAEAAHETVLAQVAAEKDHNRRDRLKESYLQRTLQERRSEYIDSHQITIKCTTWNMAGKDIAESLQTLLRPPDGEETTIYCTAFQEMDLRAEAYLTTTDTKAQNYQAYIEGAIGDLYELVASHQLVGMLLCIYAHKSIMPTISNVVKSYVPCGILGMIGNKGAVGIKFDIMDTPFAFVNCHLAAGQGGSERRNADLRDIEKRIFNDSGIWDSGLCGIENIFILGDLNYRLSGSRQEIESLVEKKDFTSLAKMDQLLDQQGLGHALVGWHEGPLTFNPTYKFDVGTDSYDTSEKQRIPSWTDRIFFKSVHGSVHHITDSYTSIPEYYQSDHKPVVAAFKASVDIILADKRDAVRKEIFKNFDKQENQSMPIIKPLPGQDEIEFGQVFYMQPKSNTFTIVNTGSSVARFNFSNEHRRGSICQPWFWPVPNAGSLLPKQQATIQVTALVDAKCAAVLNADAHSFRDILVLRVAGGTDSYITLNGAWQSTCIGQSLERLSSSGIMRDVQGTADSTISVEGSTSVPKVIHRICDRLQADNMPVKLFATKANRDVLDQVQDALDTDQEFPALKDEQVVMALSNLLLEILASMTLPLIPQEYYRRIAARESAVGIVDDLPSLNLNLLIYLQGFFATIIQQNPQDSRLRDRLCKVFSAVLIRHVDRGREDQGVPGRDQFVSALIAGA